jgi:2-keto-3-deoxy-L-rhamnonate aldolase RhmA
MKNKNVKIGSWITIGHSSIVEIMAPAGFDWLCIDMEHTVIDYFEAQQLIAAIQSKGLVPYVRVGENNARIIKRVLDAGAEGIIVPFVNSKADAEKAVSSVKYPPWGNRGVNSLSRAQGYGFGFDEYAKDVNKKTKVIAQIEHIDAIKNLEEILMVKGIDGTIIGPYDLSGSMGKPGKYYEADVKEVLNRYENISKKLGKPMGFHVIEPDYRLVVEKIKAGYSFIAFSWDTYFLGSKCREEVKKI